MVSAIPLFAPAATWASGEAGEGTRGGGSAAPGRCWAPGEHKAHSPALPGLRGSLRRNKGAAVPCRAKPCRAWHGALLSGGHGRC